MKRKIVLFGISMLFATYFISCSKNKNDDNRSTDIKFNTIAAIVDNQNITFTTRGYKTTSTTNGQTYNSIVVLGTPTDTTTKKSVRFQVTATSIGLQTYQVPLNSFVQIDPVKGFAIGNYTSGSDYYDTGLGGKVSGSVTITAITDTSVKGSFDMILALYMDSIITKNIKGNFYSKVYIVKY